MQNLKQLCAFAILTGICGIAAAQNVTVSGTVKDAKGVPVQGASVQEKKISKQEQQLTVQVILL